MYRRGLLGVTLVLLSLTSVLFTLYKFPAYKKKMTSDHDVNYATDEDYHAIQVANTSNNKSILNGQKSGVSVTLYVRLHHKHGARFYCFVLRTLVVFWPTSFGKIVIVFDEESPEDQAFGKRLVNEMRQYFPMYHLEAAYEPLPNNSRVLNFPGSPKSPGYNRQLWNSFFMDLYTSDTVIAWMDSDAAFVTPVTNTGMFNGTKLRAIASQCTLLRWGWVSSWAKTTEAAIGLPFVADFMVYFPVYIYRDTIKRCREHILNRFKTRNFEEAFMKFYKGFISPVSVILSYAWYFERDRYEWNFKICTKLEEYNKKFPVSHKISEKEKVDVLPVPQTGHHGNGVLLESNALLSYCLALNETGQMKADKWCLNKDISLKQNLILFKHDLQRFKNLKDTPCLLNEATRRACLQSLERHYREVGSELRRKERKMNWEDLKTVEGLAKENGFACRPIPQPGK